MPYYIVDSQLAKSQNMLAVSEILNGCVYVSWLVSGVGLAPMYSLEDAVSLLGRCRMHY
jgi:hypothetical protein